MNDSCFVILIWVSLLLVVVAACATTNEVNCGRVEDDRMTNNTSVDTKTPTIALIHLLVTLLGGTTASLMVHDFSLLMIATISSLIY
jgi:hypothetical protein